MHKTISLNMPHKICTQCSILFTFIVIYISTSGIHATHLLIFFRVSLLIFVDSCITIAPLPVKDMNEIYQYWTKIILNTMRPRQNYLKFKFKSPKYQWVYECLVYLQCIYNFNGSSLFTTGSTAAILHHNTSPDFNEEVSTKSFNSLTY